MYPRRLCSCDQDTASGPMYVHAGLEGSVIALTNVLGDLVERYRYTAFGLLTVLDAEGEETDGDALSPWLYHGRLYEQSTGLYWMRMRHYSPQLGRFLQPDPAGIAGGINLYAYSNNNPLRYFDPWGLWPAPDASGGDDGKYGEADPQNEKKKKGRVEVWTTNSAFGKDVGHHLYAVWFDEDGNVVDTWGRNGSSDGSSGGDGVKTEYPGSPESPRSGHTKVGDIDLPAGVSPQDYFDSLEENGNRGLFLPGTNDCHTSITDAAKNTGSTVQWNSNYEGRLTPVGKEIFDSVFPVIIWGRL